jgi:hypothetical protein
VKGLLKGVVEPDIAADRKVVCRRGRCRAVKVRHHAGVPWDLVKHYFNLACFYRARGDLYMAGVALGRAMHYIHDGAVKATGKAHDEIEREMDELVKKLPDLCRDGLAKRANKAAEALCTAYLKSGQLVEWFTTEPQPPRKEALKALRRGRVKRWWPAAAFAVVFTSFFVAPPIVFSIGFLLTLLWLMAVWNWVPEEYVVAMRGGAACVKPRGYLPAITC